jgi:hypothetical protein
MTGRPAHTRPDRSRPDRWPTAYTLSRRVDAATETLTGLAATGLLLASHGLLHVVQAVTNARLARRENRSQRWGNRIQRELDWMRLAEDGGCYPDDDRPPE